MRIKALRTAGLSCYLFLGPKSLSKFLLQIPRSLLGRKLWQRLDGMNIAGEKFGTKIAKAIPMPCKTCAINLFSPKSWDRVLELKE
jgi:hypothetical protein